MADLDDRISYKQFLDNILTIKTLSDQIGDDWGLLGKTDDEGGAYLQKKSTITLKDLTQNESNFQCSEKIIICEYHIVYNLSYGVPMLCLNMWTSDGNFLPLEEAWNLLDKHYIHDNMYSVLTQQDHPILQIPFMVLHPCKTAQIIKNFKHNSNNIVISWLSSIGPAVHLNLNLAYEKLCS